VGTTPVLYQYVTVTQAGEDCGSTPGLYCVWSNMTQPAKGTLEYAGDKDWFYFVPSMNGVWTFTAAGSDTGALANSTGTVYQINGTTVLGTNTMTVTNPNGTSSYGQFKVQAQLSAGVAYFIEIKAADNASTGGYTITATTPPAQLLVSASSWSAGSAYASTTVNLTANTPWQITGLPSWLTAAPASGTGNATVTLMAAANSTASDRSAQVVFATTSANPPISVPVPVTQAAAPSTLTVAPTLWSPVAAGGTMPVTVTSNTAWQVTGLPSWVTSNVTSGNGNATLTLTAQANPSTALRAATVNVTTTAGAPQVVGSVTITQTGQYPTLAATPPSWNPGAAASAQTVTITSNSAWQVGTLPSWMSASPMSGTGDGMVTFSVQGNPDTVARVATVALTTPGTTPVLYQYVTVTQAREDCGSSVGSYCMWSSLTQPATGTLETSGDKDWFYFIPSMSGVWTLTASGAGATPLAGSAGTVYQSNGAVVASANAGSGQFSLPAQLSSGLVYFIEIKAGNGVNTGGYAITATTPPTTLNVDQTSWSTGSAYASTAVRVTANTPWQITGLPSWLTAAPMTSPGDATVTLMASANPTASDRTGTVTFTTTTANPPITKTIQVTQAAVAPTLTIAPTPWYPAAAGGTIGMAVTSNSTWQITSLPTWVTATATTGTGNSTVTLTAQPNPTTSARTDTVTVVTTAGTPQVTQTMTITQAGQAQTLSVTPLTLYPSAALASYPITVTSNCDWQVTTPAWITANVTSGSGNATVTLTVQQNTDTSSRWAYVGFTTTGGITTLTQSLYVNQPVGPTLSVPPAWNPPPTPTSGSLPITTNGSWTLTGVPAWIAANSTSGNGNASVTLTPQANSAPSTRTATMTVTATYNGVAISRQVVVTQQIFVTPLTWNAPAGAATVPVTITPDAGAAWTITGLSGGLAASATQGSGTSTVRLAVQANPTTAARSWSVTVSSRLGNSPISMAISVIQRGGSTSARTYVALGDSYSTGLGVFSTSGGLQWAFDPSESLSGKANADGCYRTTDGWPRLLASSDPTLSLADADFVACSGALMSDITPSLASVEPRAHSNNAAQDTRLNASTQVVTLTVGGNDMGFAAVAEACVPFIGGSCSGHITSAQAIVDGKAPVVSGSVLLSDGLQQVYRDILAKAPNATIDVMGYPNPIAANPTQTCLYSASDGSPVDARNVYLLVGSLNQTIHDAVTAVGGGRIHYVDPNAGDSQFVSHGLCSSDPWINRISASAILPSVHPNLSGNQEWARLAQEAIG